MKQKLKGINRLWDMIDTPLRDEYDRLKIDIMDEVHRYCHKHNFEHIHDFFGNYIRRTYDC